MLDIHDTSCLWTGGQTFNELLQGISCFQPVTEAYKAQLCRTVFFNL